MKSMKYITTALVCLLLVSSFVAARNLNSYTPFEQSPWRTTTDRVMDNGIKMPQVLTDAGIASSNTLVSYVKEHPGLLSSYQMRNPDTRERIVPSSVQMMSSDEMKHIMGSSINEDASRGIFFRMIGSSPTRMNYQTSVEDNYRSSGEMTEYDSY